MKQKRRRKGTATKRRRKGMATKRRINGMETEENGKEKATRRDIEKEKKQKGRRRE